MHTSLRTVAVASSLVVGVALGAFGAGGPAGAATAQFPTETTVAPGFPTATTVAPGFPTATTASVSTTLAVTPTTTAGTAPTPTQVDQTPAADSTGDPEATRTVWMAIAGLGLVAFLILVLTIIYARHTRPDRRRGGKDDWAVPDSPDEVFAPTAARSVFEHQEDEQGFWWAED